MSSADPKAGFLLIALTTCLLGCGGGGGDGPPPPNPAPSIASLSPSTAVAGGAGFTVTVSGSGFLSSSSVQWNGSNRPATFVSSTQLTVAAPASDFSAAGTAQVTVLNPAPGGGTSNAATFIINNPVPAVTSVSPQSAGAGAAALALTINGTGFVSTSLAQWDGGNRPTTFVSSTQLTVAAPASDFSAAGTAQVTVVNPAPGGGTSNAATFTINNPMPALATLSPPAVAAQGQAFTFTVDGTNFVSTSVVQWNGSSRPTTFVSSTRLTAAIPASDIAVQGIVQVTVSNPAPGGGTSGALSLVIGNPVPSLVSLSPSSALSGSAGFTLTVNGSGFISNSVVRWNGSDRQTGYANSTLLQAAIPASDLAVAGNVSVTVFNPPSVGGTSNALTFAITNPAPSVTSLSPSLVVPGATAFTLTVNGSGFATSCVVRWNGSDRTTTFVSATQVQAAIPASDIATPNTAQITVFNPAPGGGTSNSLLVDVGNPVPGITGVSPSIVPPGGILFTLAVSGSNFVAGSVVRWNGSDRPTTWVSRTLITAAIPAADIATAGTADVTVFNPAPAGGTSNPATVTMAPLGVIERVSLDSSGNELSVGSSEPSTSATGRFVSFIAPTNTAFLGIDFKFDAFLRDTCIGATSCSPSTTGISVNNADQMGGGVAGPAAPVSSDGRFVAFASRNPLVLGDTNAFPDVFVRDTCAGAPAGCTPSTVRVSVATDGAQGNSSSGYFFGTGAASFFLGIAISADGRFVAFGSRASNLVPNDSNNTDDVFVRDTCMGAPAGCTPSTTRVSVATDGSQATSDASQASISADGRFVAFSSFSPDLVPGDTNNDVDVFVRDTCTGAPAGCTPSTIRASIANDGTQIGGRSPSISADGRFVAFNGWTLPVNSTFVRDTCLGAPVGCTASTIRASVAIDGTEADGALPSISADGRFVSFSSDATDLVTNDTNGNFDIFVADTCIGAAAGCSRATIRISVASDGTEANDYSLGSSISADGRFVSFRSRASNLVGGDTNNSLDVFLARTGFNPPSPLPTLASLLPSSATAGTPGFTLTVTGTNFVPGSVVEWNGTNRVTFYVSSTKLNVRVLSSDLAAAGSAVVTVFNPAPGGGTSSSLTFTINP